MRLGQRGIESSAFRAAAAALGNASSGASQLP